MGENIIAGSKPTNVEKNHDNEEGLRGQALQRPLGKKVELTWCVESTYLVNSTLWSLGRTDALSAQPT